MPTIMEALRSEHANTAKLLDLLEAQLAEGSDADFDLIKSVADYFQIYPDQYHHPKEDLVYRALLEAEPETGASLNDLEAEHVELAERTMEFVFAVERILSGRADPGHWFVQLGGSFLDYYRRHMTKEETGFFREAERVLDAATFYELESRVINGPDPLFDLRVAGRLAQLRERVVGAK